MLLIFIELPLEFHTAFPNKAGPSFSERCHFYFGNKCNPVLVMHVDGFFVQMNVDIGILEDFNSRKKELLSPNILIENKFIED
jgi:hypothetical protein